MFLLPGVLFLPTFIVQINLQIFWEDYLTTYWVTKQVLPDNMSFVVVFSLFNFSDIYDPYFTPQYMTLVSSPYHPNKRPKPIHLQWWDSRNQSQF